VCLSKGEPKSMVVRPRGHLRVKGKDRTAMITIEEKRALYLGAYEKNKVEVDCVIDEGIEKHRKGYCKLRLFDKMGNPIANRSVTIRQKTHDFKYGANIFMLDEFEDEQDNAAYRTFFKEHFNLATVPFYWDALEPVEGKPRYDKNSEKIYRRPAPDLCVAYCEENGLLPKLHCLVYDKFIPAWLAGLPLAEVKKKYEERFRQIAERYAGRMYEFEVINELLYECYWDVKTPLSEMRDIIEWSFATARKYLPNEVLVINEGTPVSGIGVSDYRHPYFMMIENALQKGVAINKIGLQNHMFTGVSSKTEEAYEYAVRHFDTQMCDPASIRKGLDVLSEFGLPLEITEVTIPTLGDTEEDEQLQADMLKLWYSLWFSHPAVESVVYWNTVDGYAYVNETWNENNCRGGLLHKDLTPKKSANMLKKLFHEVWHTDLELTTDKDGCVEFCGFYGDYALSTDCGAAVFGVHKFQNNDYDLELSL